MQKSDRLAKDQAAYSSGNQTGYLAPLSFPRLRGRLDSRADGIEVAGPTVFLQGRLEFYRLAGKGHAFGYTGLYAAVEIEHEEVELRVDAVAMPIGRRPAT